MNGQNKYTVAQRLNVLESRCTALEQENSQLRAHLAGALQTAINDAANTIQSSQKSDFRELQASIRIPQDGAPGRDGVDGQSIVGPKGDAGDVLVIPESELAQAVLDLRRKLKEQHATFIARLIEGIEANRRPESNHLARILATHLETIKTAIERLG
jgi:hypothetical protein